MEKKNKTQNNIDRGVKQLKVKSWTSALILEMTFTAVSVPDCFLLKKKKVIKADSEMSATIKKILSNKEMFDSRNFSEIRKLLGQAPGNSFTSQLK